MGLEPILRLRFLARGACTAQVRRAGGSNFRCRDWGRTRAVLEAILLVRFDIWDFIQGALEILPIEELRRRLNVLAACEMVCKNSRRELLDRDVVPGGEF